ncbi:MATE family efflux transporter [Litchfieldia salsa]|uniref:Multidrug resistance protein, MATE family n=1 Tax=Litchfieldia salsa TaxID=930152 RepID=A0A1H0UT15_9BACI|nr:MATE family efflux transporter [Litchfieldia salsa]SDP69038.1 multidrug resistance protein, MATE family [Litchfieldia salsa]
MKQAAIKDLQNNNTEITHKSYLLLAFPLIISGLSTPILGAVDTAVVGRLAEPSMIGGVAIGALIFNIMYWLFGFLRVSTTSFTAQAEGSKNVNERSLSFFRPLSIAIVMGFFFILVQYPILHVTVSMMGTSESVADQVKDYFYIRIWGAPFTLASYVLIGWMMGMSKVRETLYIQLFMNGLNIILDILFVIGLGYGVKGVASATLISEISAVIFAFILISRGGYINFSPALLRSIFDPVPFVKMIKMNRDLFLRTVCLLTMTFLFTREGARMGEVTLAANAILLQIQYILAYFFGGLANASSILIGRAFGEKNTRLFSRVITLSAQWGFITATILALTLLSMNQDIVGLFTTITEVRDTSIQFFIWMIVFPFVGFWGLQLEGIFSGAARAKEIRNSIALALIVFLISLWGLTPYFGNHGLWIAFILFSFSRSMFLWMFVPKLTRLVKN